MNFYKRWYETKLLRSSSDIDIHSLWSKSNSLIKAEQDLPKQIEALTKAKTQKNKSSKKDILLKRILRFSKRLNYFLENNVWIVRKAIKLTDEDKKLQDLLISLNKEMNAITYEYRLTITGIEGESKEIEELNFIYSKVIETIQKELKNRDIRREKRKIAFILDS